jgi:hypothetical protein
MKEKNAPFQRINYLFIVFLENNRFPYLFFLIRRAYISMFFTSSNERPDQHNRRTWRARCCAGTAVHEVKQAGPGGG